MYTAELIDIGTQRGVKEFGDAATVPLIQAFLTAQSGAGLVSINQVIPFVLTATPADAGSDKGKRALFWYRDGDGDQRQACVLAPTAAIVTEQTEEGERITPASGLSLATDHATLCGYTTLGLTFLSGLIVDPLA